MIPTVGYLDDPYRLYYEVVEATVPAAGPPIVMLHGGGTTGACYRVTPDGRPGWADLFASKGFSCVVTDWPGRGRSGYVAPQHLDYELVTAAYEVLLRRLGGPCVVMTHSMSGPIGWKLLETVPDHVRLVVGIAPGPPGNIQPMPPRSSSDEAATVVVAEDEATVHVRVRGLDMHVKLGEPYVDDGEYMRHGAIGASTRFPTGSYGPFRQPMPPLMVLQRVNWRGRALQLASDVDLAGRKVLVVTGTADTNHRREDDRAVVDLLAARGAEALHLWLGDVGIEGNGHMLMFEDNSAEIAVLIAEHIVAMLASEGVDASPAESSDNK